MDEGSRHVWIFDFDPGFLADPISHREHAMANFKARWSSTEPELSGS
jgi:hypothetical protein